LIDTVAQQELRVWRRSAEIATECELISNLATQKRELFKKLAEHLASLATEVERAMAAKKAGE
jgi:hypothetical protein